MKHIYLNLKRFDIAKELGGVNDIAPSQSWARRIVEGIEQGVKGYAGKCDFAVYLPEGHILGAEPYMKNVKLGCQGVYRNDVTVGGNFGAFTTFSTAKSAKQLGATTAIIGHCEERNNLREIISMGGGSNYGAINEILNKEVKMAQNAGMDVLYCVGERSEETDDRYNVLKNQLEVGLDGADLSRVVVAYEPVWSIGPGKPVPTAEYIDDVAKCIKTTVKVDVIYGGGLKVENAEMIAGLDSLDGGLIALTTFGKDFGFSVENYLKIVKKYMDSVEER